MFPTYIVSHHSSDKTDFSYSSYYVYIYSFIFLHFILLYLLVLFLEVCYFLMKDRKGVDLDGRGGGEELGGVEGGEIIIKIYYIRTKSIFSKNKQYFLLFV